MTDTRDIFTKAELLAEIDRLRAELAEARSYNDARYHDCQKVQEGLREARTCLAAVIALCDDHEAERCYIDPARVRAAATGDTK